MSETYTQVLQRIDQTLADLSAKLAAAPAAPAEPSGPFLVRLKNRYGVAVHVDKRFVIRLKQDAVPGPAPGTFYDVTIVTHAFVDASGSRLQTDTFFGLPEVVGKLLDQDWAEPVQPAVSPKLWIDAFAIDNQDLTGKTAGTLDFAAADSARPTILVLKNYTGDRSKWVARRLAEGVAQLTDGETGAEQLTIVMRGYTGFMFDGANAVVNIAALPLAPADQPAAG